MLDPTRPRRTSFLYTGIKIEGILEILTIIENKPTWFSQVCRESKIRFRPAVLKYLNYCKEKGLIHGNNKMMKLANGRGFDTKAKYYMVYSITIKGSMVLEWFK